MYDSSEDLRDLKTFVVAKARKNEDRVAIRFEDRQVTFRELERASARVARYFGELGVAKGEKVALMLFNCPEYLYLWLGLARMGAVTVPLNTALKGDLLRYELEDSDARAIVVDARLLGTYRDIRPAVPSVGTTILYDRTGEYGSPADVVPFPQVLGSTADAPEREVQFADPAAILYTSGTTGPPKGVVIPHYSYISTGLEWARLATARESDVFFTALPLFHCSAQHMSTMGPLLNDLPAAYAEWFSASQFWQQAAQYGATITYLLIAMVNILYKQPARPTDRQHPIRVCVTAGTPRDIWQPFEERFRVRILELYGMTETGCTTIMNPPEGVRIGSVGLPTSYAEAKIVDDLDQELPPLTKGELLIRPRTPYSMMLEYHKKPEETVRAWRNLWFHTGDYAYRDADGYVYFVDRKRDIIRRRGENIAPYDIERVVNAHPDVFEAVAVAVPADVGDEDVKMYVQLRPEKTPDPVALVRWCDERLPFFMVPRYIEFIEAIPRTANQKAQRHLLRNRGIGECFDRERIGYKPRVPAR